MYRKILNFLVVFSMAAGVASAQDLKDELDALEDFPAEDTPSGSAPSAPAQPAPDTTPPPASPEATAPSTPPANPPTGGDDPSGLDDELAKPEQAPVEKTPPTADVPNTDGLDDELGAETPPADAAPSEVPPKAADNLEDELNAVSKDSKPVAPKNAPQPESPTEGMTGVDVEASTLLNTMDFRQLPDRVRLTLSTSRAVDFTREKRAQRKQWIVELKNARISNKLLKRALDTGEFDGPVAIVQAFDSKSGTLPTVKILFQLRQMNDPKIIRKGDFLFVDFFYSGEMAKTIKSQKQNSPNIPETFLTIDEKTRFTGSRIDLNVKNADIQDVLNLLSKVSGKNFVLAGKPDAKVTLNVRNTPWDQVLSMVLFNSKLGYQRINGVYRILPVVDLRAELDEAAKSVTATEDILPIETKLVPLNYAKAADVQTNVKDFMSKRGKLSVEVRTNSLIVSDIAPVLDKVTQYVRSIDKQTTQVLIEGRIVEATQQFTKALSVDWKLGEFTSGKLQESFVNVGPAGGIVGVSPSSTIGAGGSNNAGGIHLKLGNLGSLGAITAALSLAENEQIAKVIASPRVVVLDNKTSYITQGTNFPVITPATANSPATTTFKPAEIRLTVTPQITSDGFVLMKINLKRENPPPANALQTSFDEREADTEMLVESGKTAVIGGIYTVDHNAEENGWPGLRSLPIFGVLFQNANTLRDKTSELLMFISPKILNSDKAFLTYNEKETETVSTSKEENKSFKKTEAPTIEKNGAVKDELSDDDLSL